MTNFNTLWAKCQDLYKGRRGTLVLSGRPGEMEISYVDYDDFVALVEGHETAEAACEAFIAKFEAKLQVEARKAALLAELAELEAR